MTIEDRARKIANWVWNTPQKTHNQLDEFVAAELRAVREEGQQDPAPWFIRTEDCEMLEKKARVEGLLRAAEIVKEARDEDFRKSVAERIRKEAGCEQNVDKS